MLDVYSPPVTSLTISWGFQGCVDDLSAPCERPTAAREDREGRVRCKMYGLFTVFRLPFYFCRCFGSNLEEGWKKVEIKVSGFKFQVQGSSGSSFTGMVLRRSCDLFRKGLARINGLCYLARCLPKGVQVPCYTFFKLLFSFV